MIQQRRLLPIERSYLRVQVEALPRGHSVVGPALDPLHWHCPLCGAEWSGNQVPPDPETFDLPEPAESGEDRALQYPYDAWKWSNREDRSGAVWALPRRFFNSASDGCFDYLEGRALLIAEPDGLGSAFSFGGEDVYEIAEGIR